MLFFSFIMMFLLVSIIYMIFFFISIKQEKDVFFVTCYECGFDSMSKVRMVFSYRFFLLAILFLVFDVEIILFLISPFIMITMKSYWVLILFLMILIVGLLYEWNWGSLNWL